jgi:hypothetical protein
MKAVLAIAATVLAFAFEGPFAAAHADSTSTSGHCTGMTVTDYISSYAVDVTNSSVWQNVTDAHLNFTTSSTGCVIVTFSGPAFSTAASPGEATVLRVRTLLDGNNLCVPAPYINVVSEAPNPQPEIATSITRICKNVAGGTHTVQAQLSAQGAIVSHVLTVTHN